MSFGVQAAIFSLEMWLIFIALSYMDARRREDSAAAFGIFVVALVSQLVATYQFVDLITYVRFWYPTTLTNGVAYFLLLVLCGVGAYLAAVDLIEDVSPRQRTFRTIMSGCMEFFVSTMAFVALVPPTLVYWIID